MREERVQYTKKKRKRLVTSILVYGEPSIADLHVSYVVHEIAAAGTWNKTRGIKPRSKPRAPSSRKINLKAALELSEGGEAEAEVEVVDMEDEVVADMARLGLGTSSANVCMRVLTTSSGVVAAAARPPATPPATHCSTGPSSTTH